jgi:hypothetical protein
MSARANVGLACLCQTRHCFNAVPLDEHGRGWRHCHCYHGAVDGICLIGEYKSKIAEAFFYCFEIGRNLFVEAAQNQLFNPYSKLMNEMVCTGLSRTCARCRYMKKKACAPSGPFPQDF